MLLLPEYTRVLDTFFQGRPPFQKPRSSTQYHVLSWICFSNFNSVESAATRSADQTTPCAITAHKDAIRRQKTAHQDAAKVAT